MTGDWKFLLKIQHHGRFIILHLVSKSVSAEQTNNSLIASLCLFFSPKGMECFLAQMRVQKGEILERLSSARNFSNMDDEENYSAANKAIRQVGEAELKLDVLLSVDAVLGLCLILWDAEFKSACTKAAVS